MLIKPTATLLVVGLLFATGQAMAAATLTVTDCGDTTPGGAPGQLRRLINDAAPGDTIVIPACTITLTGVASEDANVSGDLDILKNLTIQGAGAGLTIIDGGGIDRVFDIHFPATVAISGLTIRNGNPSSAIGIPMGGGITNQGTLTLINVTVSGNTAPLGGGIASSTLLVTDSAITGNTATNDGGGLFIFGLVELVNTTVSGNSAGRGGGVDNSTGAMTLTNVTIAGNSAGSGGGISNFNTIALKNTIVANNAGANCGGAAPVTSQGHNLDSGTTCGLTGPGDLSNTGPLLGPLANNGGPTQTHALLTGSPAIDAGDNAGCPATDQRGTSRPQGGVCDIGAYEHVPVPQAFFTLTPCRVADTRNAAEPSGGPALAANTTRTFPAAGLCGIPSDAGAVAINVTVVAETDVGDLRLYAAGRAAPTASTINFTASRVRANNAIIPLGTGGQITVQCDMLPGSTGTTHFLFDVTGYFR